MLGIYVNYMKHNSKKSTVKSFALSAIIIAVGLLSAEISKKADAICADGAHKKVWFCKYTQADR